MIPFNKPYLAGNETKYIANAIKSGKISGNGMYTKECHSFFEKKYNFNKCLLTTSCTDALEMAAILIDTQPGDEIIMPAFTFVSTANAFVLRGAKIVFVDSKPHSPGIDETKIEALITNRTKAIVPVHYAGVACDMDKIMKLAHKYHLFVIEDAAQAIDSFYTSVNGEKTRLGSIGHLAAFSFHETKNITSGEGGMLVINDTQFVKRAEIIWEKGTNRSAYFKGEVNKYEWVDIGSSFLPSEIIAAFLAAQLENIDKIQQRRKNIWETYYKKLNVLVAKKHIQLPFIPEYASNNAHLFYIICSSANERGKLIEYLKSNGIMAVFHYQSLPNSFYYSNEKKEKQFLNSDKYSDCLLRLPLFYELKTKDLNYICDKIIDFYSK
ncbi:MAG: dTDP-4-amino-4,6-dideoxygalactose transaminase [Bacteroidia bacterium]|nr:dTDP-4-amino-4,6-dideoxygalactose transaminase [Bacteroidia bacterium]